MSYWNRLFTVLGVLILASAGGSILYTLVINGDRPEVALLEVVIDAVLIGFPGAVMVYVGVWLPTTTIPPELYSRIAAWTAGGVAAITLAVGLRELHPGIDLDLTVGTHLILLSIGSVTGLLAGVQNARTLTQAKALERKNAELEQKYELERQNERLRQTEQRLEEAVSELESSNERLEEFAYAVSHDLQEPLRMVTSYLELLERRYGDDLDEDAEEFIEYAVDGADRMRAMIDGLLEYSRVETEGEQFEPVDLDAVLDDVCTDLQFKIEEHDAELTREPLPTVDGDENQLRQVFQNLLSNAIDYSGDEPPRIHVSAEPSREDGTAPGTAGTEWTIAVRDEGVGIDPDDRDRIFNIFQRLHSIDEQSGSGIGLAVCKRIVERHGVRANSVRPDSTDERSESVGGEIWVESEPGVGSTFRFTLPEENQESKNRQPGEGAVDSLRRPD
ncbi:sensor histidine kinase [Natronorubrum texcoconense]|uniref:histidine kinase n=1 Tax=Natronorubrum texcoconense TaxID=1095776 RepID=A0A1G9GV94_9EURY|nr:ATP-binding protein [Natronorubrum texcoconense]SDL04578.1 4TM region of histidine kinase [Natronorubrum texcoconense]